MVAAARVQLAPAYASPWTHTWHCLPSTGHVLLWRTQVTSLLATLAAGHILVLWWQCHEMHDNLALCRLPIVIWRWPEHGRAPASAHCTTLRLRELQAVQNHLEGTLAAGPSRNSSTIPDVRTATLSTAPSQAGLPTSCALPQVRSMESSGEKARKDRLLGGPGPESAGSVWDSRASPRALTAQRQAEPSLEAVPRCCPSWEKATCQISSECPSST